MQHKKVPSIFLKIESEHRQVIWSMFPKSFRSAGDLMVLGEFCKVAKKKPKNNVIIKLWEKSKVPFCMVQPLVMSFQLDKC